MKTPWRLTARQAEIKLDIDADAPEFDEICRLLRRAGYKATTMGWRRSPGGRGWHINIQVKPRPEHPMEVVALQLLLGGDPNREAMQLQRARRFWSVPYWMRETWNVLYLPDSRRSRHIKTLRGENE